MWSRKSSSPWTTSAARSSASSSSPAWRSPAVMGRGYPYHISPKRNPPMLIPGRDRSGHGRAGRRRADGIAVEQGRGGGYSARVGVSGQQSAVPVLEGDGRGRGQPSFALVESKLRAPWVRPGIVERPGLVERLLAAGSAPLVYVVAPAGYGKTT